DALVKCCKELGIFMELFDPRWRRAWEDKYKAKHLASKAKKAWPAARDGGAVPASGSASPSSATTAAPSSSGAASTAPAAADTGEAATPEQIEAIKGRVKELGWKVGMLREWFHTHFGIASQEPARIPGALTQVQADAAMVLLLAFNQGAAYQRLVGELREKGVVLR